MNERLKNGRTLPFRATIVLQVITRTSIREKVNRVAQRIGQNKILGLAIGERSLVVAEASRLGGTASPRVTLAATFPYATGLGLDTPAELGRQLAEFLKEKGFTAKQVAVGVPARWVLNKSKEVPPADPSVVAEALRLQVEGEFSQELKDLSYDYVGDSSTKESKQVLLVAMQGKHLSQVTELMQAAKLQLYAITPVGCVLGSLSGTTAAGKVRHAMVVSVGPGGIEFASSDGAVPRALRHLGGLTTSPANLAIELRRAAYSVGGASLPVPGLANGHNTNGANGAHGNGVNGNGTPLVFWDGAALTDVSRKVLADAAGAKLEAGDLGRLGVSAELSLSAPELAGAAALAVAALNETLPVNFLESKLAEPKKSRLPPQATIIGLAVALVLLLVLLAWSNIHRLQARADELDDEATTKKSKAIAADAVINKDGYTQAWRIGRERYIACLADLKMVVPGNSPRAYLSNFTLREKLDGSLRGRAQNPQYAQEIVDKMIASERFANVKLSVNKQESRGSTEYQFTIDFVYVPDKAIEK